MVIARSEATRQSTNLRALFGEKDFIKWKQPSGGSTPFGL